MFHWTIHVKGDHGEDSVAVAVGHEIYCFRGDGNPTTEEHLDVHVFNTVSLCWLKLTPVRGERHLEVPYKRSGQTAVLIEDTVYLWGGYWIGKFYNVLYAFDVDTHRWFKPQVSGSVPEGKTDHSACVLEKVMFIYGGWALTGLTNDIYKLDTSTRFWSLINTRGTPPPTSLSNSATIIGTKMFVFGGWEGKNYNIIVFDTETNCWLNTPQHASTRVHAEGRWDHEAFAYNGELHIFGGWKFNYNYKYFNDLWKFSPETFCWKKVEPKGKGPSPTYRYKRCCCMVGDRIFLLTDDLYVIDLRPSLKTLCKLVVIRYDLERSELPHNIRWELAAMTTTAA